MAEKKEDSLLPETNDNDKQFDQETKVSKVQKSNKKNDDSKTNEDEELSELLDSALKDFALGENTDDKNDPKEPEEMSKPIPPTGLWDEEFLKQTAERFGQSFQSGFGAGDTPLTAEQLGQNIESMAEAVTQMAGGAEASPDMEFSDFFAQTLKQFSETPQGAQAPLSEEEFGSMMAKLNSYLESPEFSEIFPFIVMMMEKFLSKDVLYGDFKGVIEKYPRWLEDNKAKLPSHEYDRHLKKLEILQEACSELEKETHNDSEEVKKARCDRLLMLMHQIQDLGPMPSEIAGNLDYIFGWNSHGTPWHFSPNQCSIM